MSIRYDLYETPDIQQTGEQQPLHPRVVINGTVDQNEFLDRVHKFTGISRSLLSGAMQSFQNEFQKLINEVIVTSDETGTQAMTSKANVELKETDNIVTVTPQPASLASQSYGYDSKSGSAYTTASKPRTGDETETVLYIVLGIFAIMSGVSAFCYRKTKKQQK